MNATLNFELADHYAYTQVLYQVSGFIDIDNINPDAWPALVADASAGEQGIIALAFGESYFHLYLLGNLMLILISMCLITFMIRLHKTVPTQ